MTDWTINNLCVTKGGKQVVCGASLHVGQGELVAIIGANGAGKSSLMRAGLGLIPKVGGKVHLKGQPLEALSGKERARIISYLPQARPMAWPLQVVDVVRLGRFAYGGGHGQLGGDDLKAVEEALIACDLVHLATRSIDTLSGGEQARVHVARCLAAKTPLVAVDEPTAALDPAQAIAIMKIFDAKCKGGIGIVAIMHDLALAARFATRIIVMKDGAIIAEGPADIALSKENLQRAFGIDAELKRSNTFPTLHMLS